MLRVILQLLAALGLIVRYILKKLDDLKTAEKHLQEPSPTASARSEAERAADEKFK